MQNISSISNLLSRSLVPDYIGRIAGYIKFVRSLQYDRIPGVESLHLSIDDRSAIAFNVFSLVYH
jgi:hypothetical protein